MAQPLPAQGLATDSRGEGKLARVRMAEHVEVDWALDYDARSYEVVLTKVTRRWPRSARGVERRYPPQMTTEDMRIPSRAFPDLVRSLASAMLAYAREEP